MFDDLHERILPGTFDRAIRDSHDVRALANHDKNQLLGRTSSGTCRLSVDEIGLRYEIDLPDTQAGRDVGTSIQRGDLDGSSFSFVPTRVSWVEEGRLMIRQVEDVDLYDVGPVTFPAYAGTSSGLRSEGDSKELREQADEIRDARRAVDTTLRILDLENP
jgi:HK97 family phage prohead protease